MKLKKNALALMLVLAMIFSTMVPALAESATTTPVEYTEELATSYKKDAQTIVEDVKVTDGVKTAVEAGLKALDEAEKAEPKDEAKIKLAFAELVTLVQEGKAQLVLVKEALPKAEATAKNANLKDAAKTALDKAIADAKESLKATEIKGVFVEGIKTLAKAVENAETVIAEAERKAKLEKDVESARKEASEAKAELGQIEELLLRQREQLRRLQKSNKSTKDLEDKIDTLEKSISELTKKKEDAKKSTNNAKKKADENFSLFAIDNPYYQDVVDGQTTTKQMDVAPYISNGRTMMPLRYAAYALGIDVQWDDTTKTATFTNVSNEAFPKRVAKYSLNKKEMTVDGNYFYLESGVEVTKGRLFVSIRDLSSIFDGTTGDKTDGYDNTVEWSAEDRAVFVYKYRGSLMMEEIEKASEIDSIEVKDIKQGIPARKSILSDDYDSLTIEAKVTKGKNVDAKFYLVSNGKVVKDYRKNELVKTVEGTEGTIKFEIPKRDVKARNRYDIKAVVGEDEKTFEGVKFVTEIPNLNGYVATAGHGYFLEVRASLDRAKNTAYDAVVLYGKERFRAEFNDKGELIHENIKITGENKDEKFIYVRVADEFNNVEEFKFPVPNFAEDNRVDVEKPVEGKDYLYIKSLGKNMRINVEIYEKETGYDIATMRNVGLADNAWTMITLKDYFGESLKLSKGMIIKVQIVGQEGYAYIYEL